MHPPREEYIENMLLFQRRFRAGVRRDRDDDE
jgi:hypothetical protein